MFRKKGRKEGKEPTQLKALDEIGLEEDGKVEGRRAERKRKENFPGLEGLKPRHRQGEGRGIVSLQCRGEKKRDFSD